MIKDLSLLYEWMNRLLQSSSIEEYDETSHRLDEMCKQIEQEDDCKEEGRWSALRRVDQTRYESFIRLSTMIQTNLMIQTILQQNLDEYHKIGDVACTHPFPQSLLDSFFKQDQYQYQYQKEQVILRLLRMTNDSE